MNQQSANGLLVSTYIHGINAFCTAWEIEVYGSKKTDHDVDSGTFDSESGGGGTVACYAIVALWATWLQAWNWFGHFAEIYSRNNNGK